MSFPHPNIFYVVVFSCINCCYGDLVVDTYPTCWQPYIYLPSPIAQSAVYCEDLRTGGCWLDPWVWLIFFPRIDDSHCDRIHSSLTAVSCLYNGYVGKQPVAWKEYCVEYWLTVGRVQHGSRTSKNSEIFWTLCSVQDLRTGGHGLGPLVRLIFFPRIDYSHCNRIHSCLTAVHCLDNGHV